MSTNVPVFLTVLILFADISLLLGLAGAFLWARKRLPEQDRGARALALVATVILLIWFVIAFSLGYQNVFKSEFGGPLPPNILYGIMGPILLFAPVVLRSSAFGRILDQFSQTVLVGYQSYRTLGVLFFVAWGAGLLPDVFVWPAGIGDILTGVFAIIVALVYMRRGLAAGSLVTAWNWFGIADLVVAVSLGFVTSPGIFLLLSTDSPNAMITAWPLVLVPVFAVPVSILLHFCSLRKLKTDRMKAGQGDLS